MQVIHEKGMHFTSLLSLLSTLPSATESTVDCKLLHSVGAVALAVVGPMPKNLTLLNTQVRGAMPISMTLRWL